MNTSLDLFKNNLFTQLSNIDINVVVYERDDDGFLLECDADTPNGRQALKLCVDFKEWNHLLLGFKNQFQAGRLRHLVSEMVLNVDWISELCVSKTLGRKATLPTVEPISKTTRLRA